MDVEDTTVQHLEEEQADTELFLQLLERLGGGCHSQVERVPCLGVDAARGCLLPVMGIANLWGMEDGGKKQGYKRVGGRAEGVVG